MGIPVIPMIPIVNTIPYRTTLFELKKYWQL